MILTDINPKIFDKFSGMPGLPPPFKKLLKKLLEAQSALDKKSSTSSEIVASFNKILSEVVDDPEIAKYIDNKTEEGSNL